MLDSYGRDINYIRISVTDLCNLRCRYCMPEEGIEKFSHDRILSVDEIEEIVRNAVKLGARKVRLTGGEPLVRRGITEICSRISAIPEIEELCLTTNGLLLKKLAKELAEAGVTRINVSLDTLSNEKYNYITRCHMTDTPVDDIFAGIEECSKYGMPANKINVVLMGGFNDVEIPELVGLTRDRDLQVRFIELMPIGQAKDWDKSTFISNKTVLEKVPELQEDGESGVSKLYRVPGYKGTVGLISTISNHFCSQCNRLRVTADGKLKACLHSGKETSIKGLSGEALLKAMADEIANKPKNFDLEVDNPSRSLRGMSQIGG